MIGGVPETEVVRRVDEFIANHGRIVAFGSLAAGADIVIVERLLAAGAEVHVVLPFSAADFVVSSVSAEGWEPRFRRCLAAAADVTVIGLRRPDDADAAYGRCSEVAMDAAIEAAESLAGAEQLAVWNGVPPTRSSGTAADVANWRSRGLPTTVIGPTG